MKTTYYKLHKNFKDCLQNTNNNRVSFRCSPKSLEGEDIVWYVQNVNQINIKDFAIVINMSIEKIDIKKTAGLS